MALAPTVPITIPYIHHYAYLSLANIAKKTLHPLIAKKSIQVNHCVRVDAKHGQCLFAIKVTLRGTSVCVGYVQVRNIGKGPETAFAQVSCIPTKKVNKT